MAAETPLIYSSMIGISLAWRPAVAALSFIPAIELIRWEQKTGLASIIAIAFSATSSWAGLCIAIAEQTP